MSGYDAFGVGIGIERFIYRTAWDHPLALARDMVLCLPSLAAVRVTKGSHYFPFPPTLQRAGGVLGL
jgi:hypothetical protein